MDIVARAKAIVLTPASEWRVIEGEPGEAGDLFANYVAYLAAIPAVCRFIGRGIFGHVGIGHALASAIAGYILTFVGLYVFALIIDALAPTFNAQKNPANSLKLAVYSATPAWLAGIFFIIPGLGFLSILSLYSLYVLWVGVPIMTKAPADKATPYTIAAVVCLIVIGAVAGFVLRTFAALF